VFLPKEGLEMDGVNVWPTLSTLFDADQANLLKLPNPAPNTSFPVAHILRQTFLARKTLIFFTGIFQKHSVGQFGTC
jgi:hypothetical protein